MSGSQVLLPKVSIALVNADGEVGNTAQRVLLVGQKLAAGSAVAGVLVTNISSSDAPENALFGAGSMLAEMVRAFKSVNPVVQLDAIPLADAGGAVARTVTFTIAGPATGSGTVTVVVGSSVRYSFEVSFVSGDTATDVAGDIVAAINAVTKCPFTAGNVAGAVTLTARNLGAAANGVGVGVVVSTGGGISCGTVATGAAGATDPTLTSVLDVATGRYQTIVWPYGATTALAAFLAPRFNQSNAIMDGVGVVSLSDSHANALTALNALNDRNLVFIYDEATSETLYIGPAMQEIPWAKSSIFAGIRSLRLTEDEIITRFLTSTASLDQFGGPAAASLPYFNTPVDVLPTITQPRGWTQIEIDQLLTAGGSIIGNNVADNGVLFGDFVTAYKTDGAGNADPTFKYLNFVDTSSQAREYFFNNLKNRFAQSRLTEGSISRGRDMANAVVIQAYLEKLYLDLAGPDFVLVQDGEAAIQFFKDNVFITLDLANGKVTISMLVPIVSQLRQIVATMKIAFSTQGA